MRLICITISALDKKYEFRFYKQKQAGLIINIFINLLNELEHCKDFIKYELMQIVKYTVVKVLFLNAII